jgi:hypothetical protein
MTEASYPVPNLPQPEPEYDPAEVIDIQLSALATNDEPLTDAGIKTAYNFASPANRRGTGPLDRFLKMVKGPQYAPMIDHSEAVTGPLEREGERARQRVTLTGPDGKTVTYLFGLSQHHGPEEELVGCWLTDRVVLD